MFMHRSKDRCLYEHEKAFLHGEDVPLTDVKQKDRDTDIRVDSFQFVNPVKTGNKDCSKK